MISKIYKIALYAIAVGGLVGFAMGAMAAQNLPNSDGADCVFGCAIGGLLVGCIPLGVLLAIAGARLLWAFALLRIVELSDAMRGKR